MGVYAEKVPFQPENNLFGLHEVTADLTHLFKRVTASDSTEHEQLFSPGVNRYLFNHCSRTLAKNRLFNIKTQLSSASAADLLNCGQSESKSE
jgi:hypothetical protein